MQVAKGLVAEKVNALSITSHSDSRLYVHLLGDDSVYSSLPAVLLQYRVAL